MKLADFGLARMYGEWCFRYVAQMISKKALIFDWLYYETFLTIVVYNLF
jgi:hypothetical protein